MPQTATVCTSRGEGGGIGHGRAEEVRVRAVACRTYRNVRNRSRGSVVNETHNSNAARGQPARCGYANGSLGMHRSFCGETSRSLRLTSLLYHLPTLFSCECKLRYPLGVPKALTTARWQASIPLCSRIKSTACVWQRLNGLRCAWLLEWDRGLGTPETHLMT